MTAHGKEQHILWIKTRKGRMCVSLAAVNLFLIIGVFVSTMEKLPGNSSTTASPTTSLPNSAGLKLEAITQDIPADLKSSLLKLHFYLQSKAFKSNSTLCQFAWRVNPVDGNITELFLCR